MALNKTEILNMSYMDKEFRLAWVRGLNEIKGASVIAALAQMMEFEDSWELALGYLGERKTKYPRPVAYQVLYFLKRVEEKPRHYKMGLQILKGISKSDFNAAVNAVNNNVGWSSNEWSKFIKNVRRDIKKI
jgi:hypothetical protein